METAERVTESVASAERVGIEVEAGIANVRMVRGDKHNALDRAMFNALNDTIDELAGRGDVRAVVLSGEGPSFCSGLDFPSFLAEGTSLEDSLFGRRDGEHANLAQRVAYGWRTLPMPVVAALHGACFGGGLQIALGADVRIAAPDSRLSVMEIKWGLIPDMGLTQTLPGLTRIDVARELIYTGRIVDGREALELGLVTALEAEPLPAAATLATEIAARSPDAIRSAKRLLSEAWGLGPEGSLALEEELQRALIGSPNQLAAVAAAMSGEPASFEDPA